MDKQTPGPVTRGEIPKSLDYLSPESRRGGGGRFLPSLHIEQNIQYYAISWCHSSLFSIYLFSNPSYFTRARIFKLLRRLGIDSKELIPQAYVAWRAGTITIFLLGSEPS